MKRYKVGYSTDEWGMNKRMGLIQDANGDAVRYVDAAKKIYELEQRLDEAVEIIKEATSDYHVRVIIGEDLDKRIDDFLASN